MAVYSVRIHSLLILAKIVGFLSGVCFVIAKVLKETRTMAADIRDEVKEFHSCYFYPALEYLWYLNLIFNDAWQFRSEIVAEGKCEE